MFTSLNDVEILGKKELGHGAFSSVRRCRSRKDGKLYALKTINLGALVKEDVDNIEREIRLHKGLDHPNIVKFYTVIREGPLAHILLEYVANSSLVYYLDSQKGLPEHLAMRFFYQVTSATAYLHSRNVLHRDIKPENVILDEDFSCKLCDFGWAATVGPSQGGRKSICGTFEYMAPEVFDEKGHSGKADVWCLGILLYELLHGWFIRSSPCASEQS